MPSAKILAQKQADLSALVEKIKGAQAGVLVDYTGITVEQDTKLRSSFRTSGVDYKVYKNTMTSRACDEVGYAEMKELLKGMTAFAFSSEDPIAPARIAKKFADDIETFDIKGGFLDGRILSRDEVLELADIPSKETLIAKLLGSIRSPLYNLAYALQAVVDKGGEAAPEEEAAAAEDAAPAEAPAEEAAAEAPAEAPAEEAAAEAPAAD